MKIIISATLTTALVKIPGILEALFTVLSAVCRISWDLREWRFRVFLDMYIVYIGMIVGISFVQLTSKTANNALIRIVQSNFLFFRVCFTVLALTVLTGYWILTRRSPDKVDFNWWQPYISCLPILSFVVLRNAHRVLRNVHSSIFAWLGRCSLETFTLQFHILLAADTKGLLRLGLFASGPAEKIGWWVESAILTIIFLWTSWIVASATNVLTAWIVDPKKFRERRKAATPGHVRLKSEASLVLPETEIKEGIITGGNASPGVLGPTDAEKGGVTHGWSVTLSKGPDGLTIRLVTMVLALWALNWVNRPLTLLLAAR